MLEIAEIEALELNERLKRGERPMILDVREPEEVAIASFPGAIHVPMGEVPSRLAELDPEAEWVIVCHHGMRSANVAMYLCTQWFRARSEPDRRHRRMGSDGRSVNAALLRGSRMRN